MEVNETTEAHIDTDIKDWLELIKKHELCLPRFQRPGVWKTEMVKKLIESIIRKRPLGVFWVLETEPKNPMFRPRNIMGEKVKPSVCRYLLLDGQQRITALWKSLYDKDDVSYFIQYEKDDDKGYYIPLDYVPKNGENGMVVDYPKKGKGSDIVNDVPSQMEEKIFPVKLLNPNCDSNIIDKWLPNEKYSEVKKMIMEIRETFKDTTLSYFMLTKEKTSRKDALNTYQTINTSSVKLTPYHLAISIMEDNTPRDAISLYDMRDNLEDKVKTIDDLETDDLGELILKIFCLMGEKSRMPSGSAYKTLDYNELIERKEDIIEGIKWAVERLGKSCKIWHGTQLPSVVPLRVLPALHQHAPKDGVKKAEVNRIVKKYLWHAFLTSRYEKQANQNLKEDFDGLKNFMESLKKNISVKKRKKIENSIEIFNKTKYPCPTKGKIMARSWPQNNAKSTLSRGILLACCQDKAKTLMGDDELDINSFNKDMKNKKNVRERHHIFPKQQTRNLGVWEYKDKDNGENWNINLKSGNLALNCMLIPLEENRDFEDLLPGDYLGELSTNIGKNGDNKIKKMLETHLIPEDIAEILFETKQDSLPDDEDKACDEIKDKFKEFLEKRAEAVLKRIEKLLE